MKNRRIAQMICLALFTLACCVFLQELAQARAARKLAQSLREAAFTQAAKAAQSAEDDESREAASQQQINWAELLSKNGDTVGWIRVEGTQTDNIVVQCANNEYYVDHDADGKKSKYGAIFADMYCSLRGAPSQNTTVYGHNMKDGQMFGELKNYRKLAYYQEHPLIQFSRVSGGSDNYKVFAVCIINAYPEQDDGYAFDYRRTSFASQDAFLQWADECLSRSMIQTTVDIQPNDEILTLSTCTYEFKEARLVVMARKVRQGEPDFVDTENATRNPDTLYPKAFPK